jgi:hypothetical protein
MGAIEDTIESIELRKPGECFSYRKIAAIASQDHEGWQTSPRRVDTLNRCHPLSVVWLDGSCSTDRVSPY